jgi:methyl-accepting chemotaxis protein
MTGTTTSAPAPGTPVRRNPVAGWFADRRISTKILIAVGLVSLVGILVGGVSVRSLNEVGADLNAIEQGNVRALNDLATLRQAVADAEPCSTMR